MLSGCVAVINIVVVVVAAWCACRIICPCPGLPNQRQTSVEMLMMVNGTHGVVVAVVVS